MRTSDIDTVHMTVNNSIIHAMEKKPWQATDFKRAKLCTDRQNRSSHGNRGGKKDDSMKRLWMCFVVAVVCFTLCSAAWSGTLTVQFRLAENKPGKDLEEMTVSGSDRKVYLHKESVLSHVDVETAEVQNRNTGFGVVITFTEAGRKKLAEVTKENVGRVMGIVVDGRLINAPVIREPVTGGKAFIEGNLDQEMVERIAGSFRSPAKDNEKAPLPDDVSYIKPIDDVP